MTGTEYKRRRLLANKYDNYENLKKEFRKYSSWFVETNDLIYLMEALLVADEILKEEGFPLESYKDEK